VRETIDNCLYEAMDLHGLKRLLGDLADGTVATVAIDTPEPSPFSHEILNSNPYAYLDDAPLEERRARAVQMRRTLPADYAAGALDPEAIATVAGEAWPPMRDADELHEALLAFGLLPAGDNTDQFAELTDANRATTMTADGRPFWVAAERLDLVRCVYPGAAIDPPIASVTTSGIPDSPERCAVEILRGWFECSGPKTAAAYARDLAMPRDTVDQALAQLEAEGQILRGTFTAGARDTEWCHRRLLARIHRLTIGRLRREIEPVTTAQYYAFLNRWQHLAPGTQLHGVDGTLQVIRQLQGAEFAAAAWETVVLPRRIAQYEPNYLDQLCLSGEVSWGRLSPHPAFERALDPETGRGRRVRPTRVAPLTIFKRDDAEWLLAASQPSPKESLSKPAREILGALESRGACFFADLTRATGRTPSDVEDALWELVAAGLVTADGFENLRALLDPKRRPARPRHAPGRWALLRRPETAPEKRAETFAAQLLQRWGVIFRDAAVREPLASPWRDLLVALRRMESRGEVRGGRFVVSFIGEQFALAEALDLLRAIRRSGEVAAESEVFAAPTPAADSVSFSAR
jgi:ATP-dependent Lhr-like helicase